MNQPLDYYPVQRKTLMGENFDKFWNFPLMIRPLYCWKETFHQYFPCQYFKESDSSKISLSEFYIASTFESRWKHWSTYYYSVWFVYLIYAYKLDMGASISAVLETTVQLLSFGHHQLQTAGTKIETTKSI